MSVGLDRASNMARSVLVRGRERLNLPLSGRAWRAVVHRIAGAWPGLRSAGAAVGRAPARCRERGFLSQTKALAGEGAAARLLRRAASRQDLLDFTLRFSKAKARSAVMTTGDSGVSGTSIRNLNVDVHRLQARISAENVSGVEELAGKILRGETTEEPAESSGQFPGKTASGVVCQKYPVCLGGKRQLMLVRSPELP